MTTLSGRARNVVQAKDDDVAKYESMAWSGGGDRAAG